MQRSEVEGRQPTPLWMHDEMRMEIEHLRAEVTALKRRLAAHERQPAHVVEGFG